MRYTFESQTLKLRKETEAQLKHYTSPSIHFFVLMIVSSAMATVGLLLDSAAIVIGAMVIAPLITPLFGFSLGALLFRVKTMVRSFASIMLGTLVGGITATAMANLMNAVEPGSLITTHEILVRTSPSIFYLVVAVLSGIAGAYAYGHPVLSERIIGIAISVALIPPLSVSGIGIAMQNGFIAQQSFYLYLMNLVGILFGSVITFIVLGFGKDIHKSGALE